MAEEYTILTPEKVAVRFQIAGIGSRVWAYLIDAGVMLVLIFALSFFAGVLSSVSLGLSTLVALLSLLLVLFGYHIAMEAFWNGQTLGKKALGIRVKMADGSPITHGAAFMRNVMRVADWLPSFYTVGLCAIFFTDKCQRLGDLVATTIVVHERRNVGEITTTSPLTEHEHPLEYLVGDLQGLSMDEYVAVKTLCDRFPELPERTQQRLLREVWQPVANRHHIPAYSDIHPVYLMEAVVMKYARKHGLL